MVGQCLVLVLRGEPASLQLPCSYLAACRCDGVRVGRCRRRRRCSCNGATAAALAGQGVLRPCLQHCKAAPQPRETGQKKRKFRQSRSDGARGGISGKGTRGERERERERNERETWCRVRAGKDARDRTERERQKAKWKEEVCIRTRHTAIVVPGKSGMRKSAATLPLSPCGPSFSLSCYITNSRLYRSRQLSFVYSQLSTFLTREEEESASPEFIPKLV